MSGTTIETATEIRPFQVEVPDGDTKNDFSADHLRRDNTWAPNTSALPRKMVTTGPSSAVTTLGP